VQLLSQPAALDITFEVGSTVPFSQPWTGRLHCTALHAHACLRATGARSLPTQADCTPWYPLHQFGVLAGNCSSCSVLDRALHQLCHIRCIDPLPGAVDPAAPPPPREWAALIEGAGLQQRVTGKTIDGRYLGKEPEPVPASSSSRATAGAVQASRSATGQA